MTAANQPCVQKLQGCTNSLESCRGSVGNIELFQISLERSKKTEAVFLGAFKGAPGGGNRNPPGSFSFCHFFFWRSKRKSEIAVANFYECSSLDACPVPAPLSGETWMQAAVAIVRLDSSRYFVLRQKIFPKCGVPHPISTYFARGVWYGEAAWRPDQAARSLRSGHQALTRWRMRRPRRQAPSAKAARSRADTARRRLPVCRRW